MNMKKRILSFLLVFAMLISIFPSAVVNAAEKNNIPTKVRMYGGWDDSAIKIELADMTHTIKNIKTSNKNLYAMLTGYEYQLEEGSYVEKPNYKNSYDIGLLSKKDGTYTVSFDIVDKDNKKVETKEIKVFSYDAPIKSITFDGKNLEGSELSGKSGKVKVTLTSGNKISKLQVGVYVSEKSGEEINCKMVYKTFKNGEKITYGTQAYKYLNKYSNEDEYRTYISENYGDSIYCPTQIQITYYDKYTKQEETITQYFYKYAQ